MSTNTQVQTIAPNQRASLIVTDPVHVLDTGRFEQMQRVAVMMAECSTIPDSFRYVDGKPASGELPAKTVIANCFRVVNQAVRWGFDPFAVMDCASIIHGKLMWEGKLIHAVLQARLGINLKYAISDKTDRQMSVTVSGSLDDEAEPRTISGTVDQWHKGPKSPWANAADWPRQLRYRGAREWARAHAPHVVLGVYGDDEVDTSEPIARVLRDVTPIIEPPVPDPEPESVTEVAIEMTPAEAEHILFEIRNDVEGVTEPEIMAEHAENYAAVIATMPESYAAKARELLTSPSPPPAAEAQAPPPADHEQPVAAAGADIQAKADRIIANMERAPNRTTLGAIERQVAQGEWPDDVKKTLRAASKAARARLTPVTNGASP